MIGTGKKGSILLAEDNEDLRRMIAGLLEDHGYVVREVSDGKIAQAAYDREHFDAIISDIRMPGGDGITFFHHVKRSKRAPFIAMTGFAHMLDEAEAKSMGIDAFIAKPFRTTDLLSCLRSILEGQRQTAIAG